MSQARLRIYNGPEESFTAVAEKSANTPNLDRVTVCLGDVYPLIADAVAGQRRWLEDFSDDEVTISADLYEVLLAYKHYKRPCG